MVERVGKPFERAGQIAAQMRREWNLDTWANRDDASELIDALALRQRLHRARPTACWCRPTCRRCWRWRSAPLPAATPTCVPGSFATEEAQRLTLARLEAQSVPIILLDTGQSFENFRKSFPLVIAHIDREYRLAGTREFDGRFGISLFVRKDLTPAGTWEPLRMAMLR